MNNKERILKCLKNVKGLDFCEEKNLISGGYVDSFEMLMLIKELEAEFGIKIAFERIMTENFNSIVSIETIISDVQ